MKKVLVKICDICWNDPDMGPPFEEARPGDGYGDESDCTCYQCGGPIGDNPHYAEVEDETDEA